MKHKNKIFAVVTVFVLAISGFFIIESLTKPKIISKPSTPEINSIEYKYDPIWHPPQYHTNPYTGEIIETPGWLQEDKYIIITVKNQPFTPYTIDRGGGTRDVHFQHVFEWKPHYQESWNTNTYSFEVFHPGTDYTTFILDYKGNNGAYIWIDVEPGYMIDIHVKAQILSKARHPYASFDLEEESSWSKTQTMTIPYYEDSPSENPATSVTPNYPNSPHQNPLNLTIIATLICSNIILLAVITYLQTSENNKLYKICG